MEIPSDLIKQVQISLRRHANLPSYDPNDLSFSDLPSPEEAVVGLDRSAADLRCRHCEGALLRGSQSFICIFCGGEPFEDGVIPEPIAFRDSLAFRWFLEFLSLDGSELVPVSVEPNNRNRGRPATNNEIPLSDLLDLEIKWPSELERFGSSLSKEEPVPSKASADFSNVIQEKGVPYSASTSHNNLTLFQTDSMQENVRFQDNLDLFENSQPSNTAPVSTEDESWGESFQSAKESTSFDGFLGSEDLSAQLDEVFGAGKESSSLNREGVDNLVESSSAGARDWFSDNSWNEPNSGLSGISQEIKVNTSVNSVDLVEDSSFDDWNDFAGSSTPQLPSDSLKGNTIPIKVESFETSFFGSPDPPRNVLLQQDLLPEESRAPEISVLSRTSNDVLAVETPSKSDEVEAILSQMDDLSFMLNTDLSIPHKNGVLVTAGSADPLNQFFQHCRETYIKQGANGIVSKLHWETQAQAVTSPAK